MKHEMVCTNCHYLGKPKTRPVRAFFEFLLAFKTASYLPLFDPDPSCPNCGKESLVDVSTEEGKQALMSRSDNVAS